MKRVRKYPKGYMAFLGARNRCTNPNNPDYPKYGGRGIEFRISSFTEWCAELGPRPEGTYANGRSLYSVDRKNNDGHYESGNLRWATAREQLTNRRKFGLLDTFTTEALVSELNRRGIFVSKGAVA